MCGLCSHSHWLSHEEKKTEGSQNAAAEEEFPQSKKIYKSQDLKRNQRGYDIPQKVLLTRLWVHSKLEAQKVRGSRGLESFLLDCLTLRFERKTASEEGKTENSGDKSSKL